MAAVTRRPAELHRFNRTERAVHVAVGVLVVVLILTATALYLGPISVIVGHRYVVETVHVWCGLALPVPLLAGLASLTYRLDLARLGRFVPGDRRWLRSSAVRGTNAGVGKFNAGQKLNAALSAGAIVVLLGTGVLMYWTGLAPLRYRTGATFVHDLVAFGFGLLVIGHVYKALQDKEAMRGARTGRVSASWARRHHPVWADELSSSGEDEPHPRT